MAEEFGSDIFRAYGGRSLHQQSHGEAFFSPILLSYPGTTIYSFDDDKIAPIKYEDTEPYKLTKSFLNSPESYFRFLFEK